MKKPLSLLLLIVIFSFCLAGTAFGENNNKLLSDIDEYIKAGPSAPHELGQSIIDQIEASPSQAEKALIEKLNTPGVNDEAMLVYVWAIGFTKDANAVDELVKIADSTKSLMIKANACQSLAKIGGNKAGKYLLSAAQKTTDTKGDENDLQKMTKFHYLNMLAEMQYAPALPEMGGLLKLEQKYYWQSLFCFGKMGDMSVPYLLGKIDDLDKNVRFNCIATLQKLTPDKAAEALSKRYWKEKDPLVRNAILSTMERIITDLKEMESFFKEVAAKEQDEKLRQFAEESVKHISEIKKVVSNFKGKKSDNRTLFETEYKTIYNSAGTEGNFENLGMCSQAQDEPRLKKLRERVLFRNSDECFDDYEKVNRIIILNRFISANREIVADTNVVSVEKQAGREKQYTIPSHGMLQMNVPELWNDKIRQPHDNSPPTIVFEPKSGNLFKILVTVGWNRQKQAGFHSSESVKNLVEKAAEKNLPQAIETELKLQELKGVSSTGYYFVLTDKAPKAGEFKYMAQGALGVGDLRLMFTILTNEKDSQVLFDALEMLRGATQQLK
jgi:hypothetical protein